MSKSQGVRTRSKKKKKKKKASPVKLALQSVAKKQRPKSKCCISRPRCRRCPLVMLADGTLPPGLTVRHRRVVAVDAD